MLRISTAYSVNDCIVRCTKILAWDHSVVCQHTHTPSLQKRKKEKKEKREKRKKGAVYRMG